jgi:hypothetical protein
LILAVLDDLRQRRKDSSEHLCHLRRGDTGGAGS